MCPAAGPYRTGAAACPSCQAQRRDKAQVLLLLLHTPAPPGSFTLLHRAPGCSDRPQVQRGCTSNTHWKCLVLVLGIVKQFGPAGFHQRGEGCAADRQRAVPLAVQPALPARLGCPCRSPAAPRPCSPLALTPRLSLPRQWDAGTRAQRGAGELGSPAERRDVFCFGSWCEVSLV